MSDKFSLGLIGYPLGHSLSPVLHQAALAEAGLVGEYSLFPVSPLPEGQSELEELVQRLHDGELQGLNITIPHKQSVLPLVDELSTSAQTIGAVNTLFLQENRLIGHNTDAPGFLKDVSRLPLSDEKVVLILGAGGAARAVVYALLNQDWQVFICDVRSQQAFDLHDHFSHQRMKCDYLTVIEYSPEAIQKAADRVNLIVNATPMGMHPEIESCAWPEQIAFPKTACLYDVVYNPAETKLIRLAQSAGLPCRNGLGMLVEQAALSFECWTGFHPSRAMMMDALLKLNPHASRSNS